jgi:hypothetical protein
MFLVKNELFKFYNGFLLSRPVSPHKRHLQANLQVKCNLPENLPGDVAYAMKPVVIIKTHCKIYKVRSVTINMEFYEVTPVNIELITYVFLPFLLWKYLQE